MPSFIGIQRCITELEFTAGHKKDDPFDEIELNVRFTHETGKIWLVPAYWAGENHWGVRFAPPLVGKYDYRTEASDTSDIQLHGQTGTLTAEAYSGTNSLLRHGALRISQNKRYLEYEDGTPFFWLADTWWMGLCHRLRFPDEFHYLTADRVRKGFNVIQIVAGLYPDMPAFDSRGTNEAGFPWTENYSTINPAYFEMADLRIDYLVRAGLMPCLVGAWGYHLPWLGVEKMKKHWRNMIARWGAHPVTWCVAGEAIAHYYLSTEKEKDRTFQLRGWTELTAYVRQIDPYHRPLTIHPKYNDGPQVEDLTLLDFDMLQTGHFDRDSLKHTVDSVKETYERTPRMPVINAEVCYEGIGEACRQEIQRLMFWTCILNGAAGHTYAANGVWQFNGQEKPYGPSPTGMAWGDVTWENASQLPGAEQLGLAKRFLERFQWWRFEPQPEWIAPHWTTENYFLPYAGGIPGEVRIFFLPTTDIFNGLPTVQKLEPNSSYRAYFWSPTNGREYPLGDVQPGTNGEWRPPVELPPIFQDWIMVLEKKA